MNDYLKEEKIIEKIYDQEHIFDSDKLKVDLNPFFPEDGKECDKASHKRVETSDSPDLNDSSPSSAKNLSKSSVHMIIALAIFFATQKIF